MNNWISLYKFQYRHTPNDERIIAYTHDTAPTFWQSQLHLQRNHKRINIWNLSLSFFVWYGENIYRAIILHKEYKTSKGKYTMVWLYFTVKVVVMWIHTLFHLISLTVWPTLSFSWIRRGPTYFQWQKK